MKKRSDLRRKTPLTPEWIKGEQYERYGSDQIV